MIEFTGTTLEKQCYIGGEWRPSSTGRTFEVFDPADGEVLGQVADASVEDGLDAVAAAAEAGPRWASRPPRERAEVLRKAYELMTAMAEDLAALIVRENGKALRDARGEVAYAAEFFRWYSEEAVRIAGTVGTAPAGRARMVVLRQPVGVAAMVTPWNFPAAMATRKLGPALAAGCTAVLKPAAETPFTAFAIADILEAAGVEPGAVNVVTTTAPGPLVSAMLHDPRVRKLSFTGSTAVGRALLKEASDGVVNCSMELGGNAPFIVFADADVDMAVEGAMVAKMRNGGEACTAANRFYVEAPVREEFSAKLAAAMAALKVGPGLDGSVDLGPMINEPAREKLSILLEDAVERGASIVTGGNPIAGGGYFFEPTVLDRVDGGSRLLHEEIFGPVAPVVGFDDEGDVVARANDTEYGLVAYVYTRDLAKGLRVAEALEVGMVGLNRGLVSDPAAPFGGVKQSGLGREGGHDGLLDYLETKYISTAW